MDADSEAVETQLLDLTGISLDQLMNLADTDPDFRAALDRQVQRILQEPPDEGYCGATTCRY